MNTIPLTPAIDILRSLKRVAGLCNFPFRRPAFPLPGDVDPLNVAG